MFSISHDDDDGNTIPYIIIMYTRHTRDMNTEIELFNLLILITHFYRPI